MDFLQTFTRHYVQTATRFLKSRSEADKQEVSLLERAARRRHIKVADLRGELAGPVDDLLLGLYIGEA